VLLSWLPPAGHGFTPNRDQARSGAFISPPSSPPDCQSSHRQGVDALSVAEARLGVRPVPLQLPCGVAAGVDMIDGETRSASTAGKLDLELHPVSRNRKVTDRTRDTDAGSSPRVIGRASRKLPLADGIAGALTEGGFVHSSGHLSARTRTTWRGVTLSERRSRARCQRARRLVRQPGTRWKAN
jgi:hypothetical protein